MQKQDSVGCIQVKRMNAMNGSQKSSLKRVENVKVSLDKGGNNIGQQSDKKSVHYY